MKVWRLVCLSIVAVAIAGCGGVNSNLTPVDKSEATVANRAKTTPVTLEPALEERLKAASPDELTEVLIVLKAPPFEGPPRPAPGTKLTKEEEEALTARINGEVTAHYERLTKPFLTKLEGLGYSTEKAITALNHVSIRLKPQHVREIATWAVVDYVETVKYGENDGGGSQHP